MNQSLKFLFLTFLSFASGNLLFSQQSVCLGTDITVCQGTPLTINNCAAGGGSASPFALINPSQGTFGDDQYSAARPIGFSFNFYGNNFSQVVIGDNGLMTFNTSQANGYCPYVTSVLPSATPTGALNSVCLAWQDLYFPAGGSYYYETIGTAPNRKFIVFYESIQYFSSSCQSPQQCFTAGVVLHEGTNVIEMYMSSKLSCTAWNNGLAVQGIQNGTGTIAHIVPGRNNTAWTAQMDGQRFTPVSSTNYTITPIPFQLISVPNSTNTVWENTLGQSFPYNNGALNIPSVGSGTVGYFISSATCGVGVGSISDTTWVTGLSSSVSTSVVDDVCSSGNGSITANPLTGNGPYTFNWPLLGSNSQTVNGVFAGSYVVNMTDADGCVSSSTALVADLPATYSASFTTVSCPGGNDGTATATMNPVIGNLTYLWDDPASQTTQTATGLTAGTYNCTVSSDVGCIGTTSVTITEIPGMIFTGVNQTNVTCNSANDGMINVTVAQGTSPYLYIWDNSTSTLSVAADLVAGTHTLIVTDAKGCTTSISSNITEPAPLVITFLTPDTQICQEDDLQLTVTGTGGSSAHTFTWFEDGLLISTGSTILVDPANLSTQYCVELSELCGSPTVQECMTISIPTPIIPSAVPDETQKCFPGDFAFFNTSSNSGEIATTFWDFMDNQTALEIGSDSLTHLYTSIGQQTIVMTITSVYGCIYTDTLKNIAEVMPSPQADFMFSASPLTIFETEVMMQDKSSFDVIDWEWYSPGSNPTSSKQEYPVFKFPEGIVSNYPVTLIVTNESGCVDTVTHYLSVIEDIIFYAPNAFTPDGDEFNQTWKPSIFGIDVFDFDLYIFNRWGEMIWENHDPEVGWDGTFKGNLIETGSYAWIARVKNPYNDDKKVYSGTITVLK